MRLNILVMEKDDEIAGRLVAALNCMPRTVKRIDCAKTLEEATSFLKSPCEKGNEFHIIYIDPLSIDLQLACKFILTVDTQYSVAFVLYMDFSLLWQREHELFQGERKKLRRYFRLNKQTPLLSLADEVEATVRNCEYDHELWNARVALLHANATYATEPVEAGLCFVIMSFSGNKQLEDFYKFGIHAVIQNAGMHCYRVDEDEHNGKITDTILRKIEAAQLVIADLSESRPNCYYELGRAHRARKSVIHTMHKACTVHFDVKDYNIIIYDNASELHDRLTRRISETLRAGA